MRKLLIIFLALIVMKVSDTAAEEVTQKQAALTTIQTHEQRLQESGKRIIIFSLFFGMAGYGFLMWNRKKGIGQDTSIRVVAIKPVGQKEKIAILEILGERMVVGVTSHHVSLLMRANEIMAPDSQRKDQSE